MEKTMKARVQHKHDIEANWLKATNFTPLVGEIVVYDPDGNYDYPRIKIGDGKTNINSLPFIKDGVSPIATVSQTGTGAVISITDKDGTTTATITNGKDGKDGYTPQKGIDYFDGQPGKDGADGAPGEKGDKGDTGLAGYTPVKGTDYWTDTDKTDMLNDVLAALPTWNGGSY